MIKMRNPIEQENDNFWFWNSPETQKGIEMVRKDMEEWHKLSREERYKIAIRLAPKTLIIRKMD